MCEYDCFSDEERDERIRASLEMYTLKKECLTKLTKYVKPELAHHFARALSTGFSCDCPATLEICKILDFDIPEFEAIEENLSYFIAKKNWEPSDNMENDYED